MSEESGFIMAERWEYQIVGVIGNEDGTATLNKLGAEGWRIKSVTTRRDEPTMLVVVLERSLPNRTLKNVPVGAR